MGETQIDHNVPDQLLGENWKRRRHRLTECFAGAEGGNISIKKRCFAKPNIDKACNPKLEGQVLYRSFLNTIKSHFQDEMLRLKKY